MEFRDSQQYMYLVNLLREKYRNREQAVEAMLSAADQAAILARGKKIREALRRHLLDEDIPTGFTQCRDMGTLFFPGYRVEKLAIHAATGLWIPVNLYLPENGSHRHGAVVVTLGHWFHAKAMEENQRFCANLALLGIAAITFDPIYQGERCPADPQQLLELFGPISEDMYMVGLHMLAGNPAYLLNKNIAALFTAEAITATDYLLSRPDIDPDRIYAAGQSGGGTQACYLAAMDDRIRGVIPIQCLSRLSITLEGGIGDCEQSFLGISAQEGMEQGDLLWAVLPKPVFHSAAREDFFSLEGVLEIQKEMTAVYQTLGKPQNYEMALAEGGHSLSRQARIHIYQWICRRFSLPVPESETETPVLPPDELLCLPPEAAAVSPLTLYRTLAQKAAAHPQMSSPLLQQKLLQLLPQENQIPLAMACRCRLTPGQGDTLQVWVGAGEPSFCNDRNPHLTITPWALEIAGEKTRGYDLETCMFNAAGVLGINLCTLRARQILTAISQALRQTGAAKVAAHGQSAGVIPLLLAAATGEVPMELTLSQCPDSLMELFHTENPRLRETDLVPGLLDIADLPRLRELAGAVLRETMP